MKNKKIKLKLKRGISMREIFIQSENMSLRDFIKKNKSKIDAITPRNYTISKDDEWRKETCWDKLSEEIKLKNDK